MAELGFPPIYLLPTHIGSDEFKTLESQIPTLTSDITEAIIVLGNIWKKERAIFELKRRNLLSIEVPSEVAGNSRLPGKRRKISVSTPAGESTKDVANESVDDDDDSVFRNKERRQQEKQSDLAQDLVKVVHLSWFTDSRSSGTLLPLGDYLIYQGRKNSRVTSSKFLPAAADILRRAKDEGESVRPPKRQRAHHGYTSVSRHERVTSGTKPPALMKETTSEHEMDSHLPPIPDFLHTSYACERPTPQDPPNQDFIEELGKIRTTRSLTGDKIGVRAYSTSIAALAAYPHLLSTSFEVSRLPGCGPKIADLWHEWKTTGQIQEVERAASDPQLVILELFYNIWGVAETTAREFYNRGWTDLDDVVEFGWDSLTRVQQIGVKFYDEFLDKIPRKEVQAIGDIIDSHANRRRTGFHMVIVGGYRRGKQESGDVDVVLSHKDEGATHNFIEELVTSLESDGYITHTLHLSLKNSDRGQAPLAWKGEGRNAGAGFDSLDKAMVVWRDPVWDESSHSENPNPHRRVDIIISPWKTVGCGVIGWSGGTTFQRDLRRYCKYVKSLKFDSSGVRSRVDGRWVDLESDNGVPAPDMLTAEKRVFEGLGLQWRPPEERCTR